ncbi:MAG: hypothetical protein ACTSVL_02190 [Promethearchaeota archaeon]
MKFKDKKKVLKIIGMMMVFSFSIEISLFCVGQNNLFIEPYNWGNRNEIPFKINECNKLFSENPDKYKVIFIGDSMGEMAFDPITFDNFFNQTTISYNLAFQAVGVMFESLLLDIILDQISPDFVIWQVNIKDLSISGVEDDAVLLSNPMPRYHQDNWEGFDIAAKFLMKNSHIYRSRLLLPSTWASILYYKSRFSRGLWSTSNRIEFVNETEQIEWIAPFFSEGAVKINDTIQDLEKRNIPYLFLNSPQYKQNISFYEFDNLMNSYSENQYLNLQGNESFDNTDFYNNNHLNKYGAEKCTTFLCEKILAGSEMFQ